MKVKGKLIIPIVILIMMIVIILILTNTNIISKIKGSVVETSSEEKDKSMCVTEKVSESYIKITGTIDQDYGEDGIATITFTKDNEAYTKEIEVKTNEKSNIDFTLTNGEYNITVSKEGYNVYEDKVDSTKELNITLHNSNVGDILVSGQVGDNVYYNYYSNGLLQLKGTGEMWSNTTDSDGVLNDFTYYNGTILNDILINQIKKEIEISAEEKLFMSEIFFGRIIGSYSDELTPMLISAKEGLENGTCPDENNSDCDLVTALSSYFSEEEIKIIIDVILSIPTQTNLIISNKSIYYAPYVFSYVNCDNLELTNLSTGLFAGSSIKSVDIKYGVSVIPKNAFVSSGLEFVNIPSSVSVIEMSAFSDANLKTLILPTSVKRIEHFAFQDNDLTTITIPDSVKEIGDSAFGDNPFEEINYNSNASCIMNGSSCYSAFDSTRENNAKLNIGKNVKKIYNRIFAGCRITGVVEIPESLTYINDFAFGGNNIEEIIIPKSVTYIGSRAFSGNKLSKITYNASDATIKNYAYNGTSYGPFYPNNSQQLEVIIDKDVEVLSSYLFQGLNIYDLKLVNSDNNLKINDYVFNDNNITSLNIPNRISSLGYRVFGKNPLEYVYYNSNAIVPSSSSSSYNTKYNVFGNNTGNGLKVVIGNKVTEIYGATFYSSNVNELVISKSVEKIGNSAFYNNKIKKLTIPSGIKEISLDAFRYNDIEELKIPNEVEQIGSGAFSNNNISYLEYDTDAFNSFYLTQFNQSNSLEVVVGNHVTTIKKETFQNKNVTKVTLGSNLESIGENAFSDNFITDITIKGDKTRFNSTWEDIGFPTDLMPN